MCRFGAACFGFLLLSSATLAHTEPKQRVLDAAPWTPSITVEGPYDQEAALTPMAPGSENYFGRAVAIAASPDAMGTHWAVVGAPDEDGGGAVYLFSLAAGSSEWHQELRLKNPVGTGGYFGGAVAIDTAAIGTGTIAIGAPYVMSAGEVFIYTRQSDGTWKNTAALSPPAGSTGFGASLLLSGDAFLFVGAPYSSGGQVITYTRSGTTWAVQRTLVPPDPVDSSHFGHSLAYDAFHFELLVGRPFNNGSGSAYIFDYRSTVSTWSFRQKLAPTDTSGNDFASSVAFAGMTAIVGYPSSTVAQGAVGIYTYDTGSGSWKEQPELQGSDVGARGFGENVAANDSGTKLLVASYEGTRSARLYSGSGGSWSPLVEFKSTADDKDTSGDEFVAFNDDLVLVGSPNAELDLPSRGIVEVFTSSGSALSNLRATTDESSYDFAFSVALSGNTALVSAPEQQNILGDLGTVNVYVRDAQDQWQWQAGLPQSANHDEATYLGCYTQIAIDGDTAVIGEPAKAVGTHPDQGVVSIYVRSGSTWTLQEMLYDRSGQSGDQFGCSVGISGNTVIAGAPGLDGDTGGGYVSIRTGDTWADPIKLVASDGSSGDFVGSSSTVAANTAVLSTWRANSSTGAAYVFTGSSAKWTQMQKLTTAAAGSEPEFGSAASLSSNARTLIVGARLSQPGMARSGSAFVYAYDGTSWVLQQTLNPAAPTDLALYGSTVSINRNTLVVGEPGTSRAHIFVRRGSTWSERATVDGAPGSAFGTSVSVSNLAVVVGATSDSTSGRAYILNDGDEIFGNDFE